ncbi:MAG: winged helix-turn-helix transcriptional regulator [Muribaculaceae bacterium]|nr:winged helix-turn-helix transcriptional regulator [Muribaculaceae bacterium]
MLRENGNKEAEFDVSKLTAFCVDVYSNEVNESTTQKTTQKTTQTLSDVQIAILEYIHNHPNASRKKIATNLNGITENGVKYHLQKLQKQGIIKRIGADKGGYWKINDGSN